RAGHRGWLRHRHGEAGAPVSRHRAPREGALRLAGGRLPRERRVRDGEGGGGARLDRRGASGRGEPHGHPARGRRHHHHVLRPGRGPGARTAMRRWRSSLAAVLAVALALAGPVGAAGAGGANDDELAGVLGHEMGHVRGHHIVRQQEKGQVWSAAALLGLLLSAVNPVAGAAGIAAAETAQLKFSREFEQEADFLGLRTMSTAGYDPRAMGTFFKSLLTEQRVNPAGVPAYMLTHPLTEDRVSHVETTISAQKLKTPAGRPASSSELAEAQAVAQAIADPPDVVIPRYRRRAEEKPDDAERHFLVGRVYQTVGQLEAARGALEKCRELGGLGGRVDRPLGSVYVALKEPAKAREALERHLTKHPDDAFAHTQLGKALSDLDQGG